MRTTLAVMTFAAGIGLICCQSAGATPASGTAVQDAAIAVSALQQAQYTERKTRRGIVKCYRDLIIGPYRCHYYPGPF